MIKLYSLVKVSLSVGLLMSTSAISQAKEPARTQFIKADATRFAYRTEGPESGVPLVLSQRFRGNMDDWDPAFLSGLATSRRVIVFNSAGVSTSSGDVPKTISGMADHMAKFVRALGLRKIDALGWSMGGFVVQSLALNHPTLVRRVVLVGTGPAGSPETPAPVKGVFDVATRPAYGIKERSYLFFADSPKSLTRANASIARIDKARDPKSEPITTANVMQSQAAAIQAWLSGSGGEFAKLKTVSQPTLVINGDRDPFFPVMAPVLLYREIPNARFAIYPMTGHGPHHQWPTHVADTINAFLSETNAN